MEGPHWTKLWPVALSFIWSRWRTIIGGWVWKPPAQVKAAKKVAPKPKAKKTAPRPNFQHAAVETPKIVNETPATPVQVAVEPTPATA
jgi:hypothetical protein